MQKEKREEIRRTKTRLQRERVAWKKANPMAAFEKTIADLKDSEARALKRRDRAARADFRQAAKYERWKKNLAERRRLVNLRGAIKPKEKTKREKLAAFFRKLVRPSKPALSYQIVRTRPK